MTTKKVLMRGGAHPLRSVTLEDAVVSDSVGSNTGNLLYANGVCRVLEASGYEVEFDGYRGEMGRYGQRFTDEEVARFNSECSAYIIPLADAFRDDFIQKLESLSDLVGRLTIPCIVVGVGLRSPYEPELGIEHAFDAAAKRFMGRILAKSSVVGLRGEITSQYLAGLGFDAGSHTHVIGCPSLYTFGDQLSVRPLELRPDLQLAICPHPNASDAVANLLVEAASRYPNAHYVVQEYPDLRRVYLGFNPSGRLGSPQEVDNPAPWNVLYDQGRAIGFWDIAPWIDHMRDVDLCVGPRLHGVVAAILGGAPSLAMPFDARMRELAAFHRIPSVADVAEGQTLEQVVDGVDFGTHLTVCGENFRNFTSFLRMNGLDILDDRELNAALAPELADFGHGETVTSVMNEDLTGAIGRMRDFTLRSRVAADESLAAMRSKHVAQRNELNGVRGALNGTREQLRAAEGRQRKTEEDLKKARSDLKATRDELRGAREERDAAIARQAELQQQLDTLLSRKSVHAALQATDTYARLRDHLIHRGEQ